MTGTQLRISLLLKLLVIISAAGCSAVLFRKGGMGNPEAAGLCG